MILLFWSGLGIFLLLAGSLCREGTKCSRAEEKSWAEGAIRKGE